MVDVLYVSDVDTFEKVEKLHKKSIKKNKNLQVKTIYRFLFLNQRVKYTFQQLTIKKNCIARYT